jgi:hypothetical protein
MTTDISELSELIGIHPSHSHREGCMVAAAQGLECLDTAIES